VVYAQAGARGTVPAGTLTVQKASGESLHDIAVRMYGDSTRWKDIATANSLATTDSKLVIPTGTRLRIPGKTSAQIATLNRATSPSSSRPSGSLASQTAGKANADSAAAAAARKTPARSTVASNRPKPATTAPRRTAAPATAKANVVEAKDSTTRAANEAASARATVDERPIERVGLRIGLVSPAEMRAARGKDQPTIFLGRTGDSEAEVRRAVELAQQTRNVAMPRHGEYAAAPFPLEEARFVGAGKVVRRLNGTGGVDPTLPRNISIADEAVVMLPVGTAAVVGQRFVSVQKGPLVSTGVYVALPTGVLEVVRADAGQPLLARVMRQSGIIEEGQALVAFEGTAAAVGLQRTVVTDSPLRGTVRFVQGEQLLPSLQTYLMLDANQTQGVQQGDEFWLVERIGTGDDARERRIAVVRIVRTSPLGSTGIVIHQDRSGIAVGAAARRVARAGTGAGD
jgi:hypothetical protein